MTVLCYFQLIITTDGFPLPFFGTREVLIYIYEPSCPSVRRSVDLYIIFLIKAGSRTSNLLLENERNYRREATSIDYFYRPHVITVISSKTRQFLDLLSSFFLICNLFGYCLSLDLLKEKA